MKQPQHTQALETVLTLTCGLIVLFLLFDKTWLLYLGAILGLSGLLSHPVAMAIHWLWMRLAKLIGWVNAKVFLSLIFFLLLTPLAFIYPLTKKDPLGLQKKSGSYFHERNHVYQPEDMEKPF